MSPQRGRVAVAAPPPAVVITPGPQFPVQPVAFSFVPAVLMSDGTVWANFGFGFEPIFRPCAQPLMVGQPAVVGANGIVLQPAKPTYTQPVPNQQTRSQQMVNASVGGTTTQVVSSAQVSCFSRNAAGQLIAFR
ncbi:MAG: hypothetical protein ACRENU_09705 [Gemmatimonadaceae bacterium]